MKRRLAAIALALSLGMSAVAFAGQVLEFRNGDLVPGKVVSVSDDAIVFAPESGGEMRVSWDRVWPGNRYDLWRSTLAEDDAAGRVKLGVWCVSAELYGPARREFLQAKGLGYPGPEDLTAKLAEVRTLEADDALADASALAGKGEFEKALDRTRLYLRNAEPGPDSDRVRATVPDLLARIEKRDEDRKEADEARAKAEKEGRLSEWVTKNMKAADDKKADAGKQAAQGFAGLAAGNVTKSRDALAKAEAAYKSARDIYLRVRRALKTGPQAEECTERMKECDEKAIEVDIRWGRLEVENKAWKKASAVVDRGLVLDPVNRELLDLRKTIDENWIRRKASDTTNASGTTSPY